MIQLVLNPYSFTKNLVWSTTAALSRSLQVTAKTSGQYLRVTSGRVQTVSIQTDIIKASSGLDFSDPANSQYIPIL